jgi:hypothetical protein
MLNRKITKTSRTFSGPSYGVAGDPVPTGFPTREKAEDRAAQLDTADAVDEARRGVTRTHS